MSRRRAPTSLSIVLPCFDEAEAIGTVVESALSVGRSLVEQLEVLVVDDGSTDATAEVVEDLCSMHPEVRLLCHGVNRGYGAALRTGFAAVRHEHVFFTDGDGQFDLSDLPRLLELAPRFDVVSAYRRARRDPWARVLNGLAWTLLTNTLLGADVRDVNCAFKLFPRRLVEEADLRSEGALLSAELLSEARRLGYSIGQVPVEHLPRRAGRATGADPAVIGRAFGELAELVARRVVRTPVTASTRA
ncbi:MAG: glycosyltransferase family 2 protein [Polyangiales bacterium]